MAFNSDNWVRVFDIAETSKHVKGFTLYKIISIVYPKNCPDAVTKVTVWKRYNDFKKLHRELKLRHKSLQIEDKYPVLPNSSFFKRFDSEVINQRRNSALTFLEYVAIHPSLFKSTEFVKFFETSHTPQESLNSNINIIRAQLNLPNDPEIIYTYNSDEDFGHSDSDSVSTFSVASTSNLLNDETSSLILHSPPSTANSSDSLKTSLTDSINNTAHRNVFLTPPTTPEQNTNSVTNYLTMAAEYITKATEFECNKKYEESFTAYKAAIANLLEGVKDDTDVNRRQMVRHKIEKYLLRAEKIYNVHLSPEITQLKNICKSENDLVAYNSIKRPIEDLFNYKVLKLMGKGMVVLHKKEHNVFYMKVIQKCLQISDSKYLNIPKDVPYMVKLFQYYVSPNAIFVVTQYVSGGSLFENIKQKSASTKYSSITFEKDTSDLPDRDVDDLYSDSSETECSYSDLITDYNSKRASISKNEKTENSDTEDVSTTSVASITETKEEMPEELKIDPSNGSNEKIEITFQRSLSERSYIEEFTMINYIPPLTDIVKWAAQLLLAIDKLHRVGIIICDLNPNKLLIDEKGNLLLTYTSHFREKGKVFFNKFENNLYSAPEIAGIQHVTIAADWWSYGAILFELLTGMSLQIVHPEGIYNYTILKIPKYVSAEGKSLLRQLIVYEPQSRLGCGINGTDDIKSHPFFSSIDWIRLQVDAFKL